MSDIHHSIQSVVRLTGLSAHVIRIWEQRYAAVEPSRTPTKRRLYTQSDVARLRLLRGATQAGHRIGQIARLSVAELRELVGSSAHPGMKADDPLDHGPQSEALLRDSLQAVRALDGPRLEDLLNHAALTLGGRGVLLSLVAPLAQAVGALWHAGDITAAHEHFTSAALRAFLARTTKPFGAAGGGPVLVVATPVGQVHEMGALLVAAFAAGLGWHVIQLGASLPALEIAGAARQAAARAVALSLVYPEDDASLPDELATLRRYLPAEIALV
ncbi:MAG: hypothetical protein RLZZ522_565, partial [Verrucomicrobiota bacterium]